MTNNFTDHEFLTPGGTNPRTLPDRLMDVINVKDYGAVGDDIADDYNAIMKAFYWNSIPIRAAANAYSGAVRLVNVIWTSAAGGTVTATTGGTHGLTVGQVVVVQGIFSTDDVGYNGIFAVNAVIDSTHFTYLLPTGDMNLPTGNGFITAHISGATWSDNVVTVNFDAPHRLISGLTTGVYGFDNGMDGQRGPITVVSPTQLRFPFTGSGTVVTTATARLQPYGYLEVESITPSGFPPFFSGILYGYTMSEFFPVCHAATYYHRVYGIVGTTLDFGAPFLGDITAGDDILLYCVPCGKVHFPPGTYRVSKQMQLPMAGLAVIVTGAPGQSIIKGNFPDFLFAQYGVLSGPFKMEYLSFYNEHVNGGCVMVQPNFGFFSGCKFTSGGVGLQMAAPDGRNAVAFNSKVEGCMFFATPGSTNSVGIGAYANNAGYLGNYFEGLSIGMKMQNFNQNIDGCSFVDCGKGIACAKFSTSMAFRGLYFKNCGSAIHAANFSANLFEGIYIEGGPDADYGFNSVNLGSTDVEGMSVTGAFATAAIYAGNDYYGDHYNIYISVYADNSGAGTAWIMPPTRGQAQFENCNISSVITYGGLTGRHIDNLSYDSGTGIVTLTTDSDHNFGGNAQISGVTVGGSTDNSYNGVYPAILASGSTVTYQVYTNPGTDDGSTGAVTGALGNATAIYIKAISWSGGIVTVEVLGQHGIAKFGQVTINAVVGGSYTNGYSGTFMATVVDGSHFTYPVVSNPGTPDPASLSTSLPSGQGGNPAAYIVVPVCMNGLVYYSVKGRTKANLSDGQKRGGGVAAIGDQIVGGGSQRLGAIWSERGWVRSG
jgi:hypothetical protein